MPGARRLILFKVLEWIALGSIGVITAIKAVGAPASPADTLEMLQRDIVRRYVLWVAILNGVAIVGRLGQALLASESKARVKAVLTVLDEACFGNQPPAERHYNRVTLFKAGWRQKKLKPYARAGERYARSIPSFRIDNGDEAKNEGVIGQGWFRNMTVTMTLPAAPATWTPEHPACREYARQALLPVAKAGKLRVKSRSLMATPLRNFKGDQWGVLVLDSRLPNAFDAAREEIVKSTAAALGKML